MEPGARGECDCAAETMGLARLQSPMRGRTRKESMGSPGKHRPNRNDQLPKTFDGPRFARMTRGSRGQCGPRV